MLGLSQYRFSSPFWQVTGVLIFVLGGVIGCICAAYFIRYGHGTPLPADSPRDLVIRGPYRYVRNPMAISSFAQGVAVGFWLGSPLVILYVLIGAVGWN